MSITVSTPGSFNPPRLNVYLLPGLGLSLRYFDSLCFPAGCRAEAISLIQPEEEESLAEYAGRLMHQVEEGTPFVLIGMSFGGVLAREMASIRQPRAIILLSTIQHSSELPWYFRMGYKARLMQVFPYRLVGEAIGVARILSGKENRYLFDSNTVSATYLEWSLNRMLSWEPAPVSIPCFQLHGGKDRLLPCRYTKNMFVIPGARHLMLPEKQREVNRITKSIFAAL